MRPTTFWIEKSVTLNHETHDAPVGQQRAPVFCETHDPSIPSSFHHEGH